MILDLWCLYVSPGSSRALKSVPLVNGTFPRLFGAVACCLNHAISNRQTVNMYRIASVTEIPCQCISKSRCPAACGYWSHGSSFTVHLLCGFQTKIFGSGTVSYLLCGRAGFHRWCVCRANAALPLSVLGVMCSPSPMSWLWSHPLPVAQHQSLSVPQYCALRTAPSSHTNKNNPGIWRSVYMHKFLCVIKAGRKD